MRWLCAVLATGCLGFAACGRGDQEGGMQHDMSSMAQVDTVGLRAKPVPAEFAAGQQLFDTNCAACHGGAALGTAQGPPLVHIFYEPNHHADMAFQMAVGNGVQQHHWDFGNMPPIPNLGPADVDRILGYVRWLQREAGVY
jgi:mono/diheme cytochrome c family protein